LNATKLPTRAEIAEKYHLSELTDGWLITHYCNPNRPDLVPSGVTYKNGKMYRHGKEVRTNHRKGM
jgi:hypothetical protein